MPLTETTRLAPVGIRLEDGYRTLVTFKVDPNISLWEIGVKPLGLDAGDPIDTTTMWNNRYRTKATRALLDTTDAEVEYAYDPAVYAQLIAIIGVETEITIKYPDGDADVFYGFLKSFERNMLKEGEFPTGNATIVSTNTDAAGVEVGPTHIGGVGTAI